MSRIRVSNRNRILLLLSAAALLLPVYGSWVDFHFAEKLPTHKHIYLGKVDLNHHRTTDSKDVIILLDQDATSRPVVVLVWLPGEQKTVNAAESDNTLQIGLFDDYPSPENAYLPPPDYPPRI